MKITDSNLAAIHGYLCADGYVITNPTTQKHKYYHIGLRNTNLTLLEDFQQKFQVVFNTTPNIYRNERCKIQSKEIYLRLLKYGPYYSGTWMLPKLSKKALASWLRAYFDCDGWVFCKEHENRHIGLDSINQKGLKQIQFALKKFRIDSIVKARKRKNIWRLYIYKRESLKKFAKQIGFLHSKKEERLKNALDSYMNYSWSFPNTDKELKTYVKDLMRERAKIKNNGVIRVNSIIKRNLVELRSYLRHLFRIESKLYGPRTNGYGAKYYELVIQKQPYINNAKTIFSLA